MSIAQKLHDLVSSGIHRIGEIEIQTTAFGSAYALFHWRDASRVHESDFGGLSVYRDPAAAREISTSAEDGTYRFAKGQVNLRRGWVMLLETPEDFRHALDQFYPACVGLFLAHRDGSIEVESLRDKLNRQTGMYRFARNISDAGAQELVRTVCGPAHQCAKRILWQIDAQTPERVVLDGIALPDPHRQPLLLRTIREELARLTAAHPQALRANRRPMSADTALRRGRMSAEVAASGDPRRLGVEIARQLHRAMTRDADAAIGSGAGPEDAS